MVQSCSPRLPRCDCVCSQPSLGPVSQKCWKKLIPGDLGMGERLPEVGLGWELPPAVGLPKPPPFQPLNHPHFLGKKQLQGDKNQLYQGEKTLTQGIHGTGCPVPGISWDIRSGVPWSKSIYSTGPSQLFPDAGDQTEPLLQQTVEGKGVLFQRGKEFYP